MNIFEIRHTQAGCISVTTYKIYRVYEIVQK